MIIINQNVYFWTSIIQLQICYLVNSHLYKTKTQKAKYFLNKALVTQIDLSLMQLQRK